VLCYDEAILSKVPDIARLEREWEAVKQDYSMDDRIKVAEVSISLQSTNDCPSEKMSLETVVPNNVSTLV